MKRVLRYEVRLTDDTYEVPGGKVVLFGRSNRNRLPGMERFLDVWVEVETADNWPVGGNLSPPMYVAIFGTGAGVPDGAVHLATTIDGEFVWHLYRMPSPTNREDTRP